MDQIEQSQENLQPQSLPTPVKDKHNLWKYIAIGLFLVLLIVLILYKFPRYHLDGASLITMPTVYPTTIHIPSVSRDPFFHPYDWLYQIVSQHKSELLKGVDAVDLKFNSAKSIGTDLYMVEFSYVQQDGTILPSGGGNVLVGKVDGKWTVPLGAGNPIFCKWVNESNLPEADKSFLLSNNACQ